MRTARPKQLHSGWWGAWVTGEDVEPDMLMRIRTRNGMSWYSKVRRVLWQGNSEAICERTDVVEEGFAIMEIPFLDHVYTNGELDHTAKIRLIRKQILDMITKMYRPAPAISNYEYYVDYQKDCALYQTVLDQAIQEVSSRLLEMIYGQSNEGDFKRGANGMAGENTGNVRMPPPGKRAKIYSSQPILPPSYLPKTGSPGPYSRLYGPDSVR